MPLPLFGVRFDQVTLGEALRRFEQACQQGEKLFCVTPNPEICLLADENPQYRATLSQADLSLPDGFGILWAQRFLKGKRNFFRYLWTLFTPFLTPPRSDFPERVTGTDMMTAFCEQYPNRRIFLLGAKSSVNEKLAKEFQSQGVNVVGHYSGNPLEETLPQICSLINSSEAEILFVAFGAPKQEEWIYRALPKLKTVRVAMGVGGAFDFLAEEKKRAPKWLQQIGLEWLFRLLIEPRRIKRIWKATVVFPWKVWRSREQ